MPAIPFDSFVDWISTGAALLTAILLALGIIPDQVVAAINRLATSVAQKQKLQLVLIPAVSLILNSSLALRNGIPRPQVQDEFSYLLAADTFGHGRLTNPTPAFWEHFEASHVLMRPTYMSKYPPGQGLALALGQVLTHVPIVGIWLTTAAACAMIYWMLLGFVPPPWAMLGGFVAVTHPLLLDWSQTYWGGCVAVLGSAMVLGAWGRLMRRPAVGSAVMLGIGLAVLANSRPYEGLVLVTPLMVSLIWQPRRCGTFASSMLRIAAPLLAILLPAAIAMGYYNFRITGHPLRMPFQEYTDQYDVFPKFWFLPKRPQPVYRNEAMRQTHTLFEGGPYDALRTPGGMVQLSWQKLCHLIGVHTDPWVLGLPLVFAVTLLGEENFRWIWLAAALFTVGLLAETFFITHYAAPIVPCLLLLIVVGWQRLSQWTRRGRRIGLVLARSVMAGFFVGAIFTATVPVKPDSQGIEQSSLIDQTIPLQNGRHLIFVRYLPGHLIHDAWVYNSADIEHSRIIWARFMGPQADEPVAKHYSGREIWLLTVGADDLHLAAYPAQELNRELTIDEHR